MKNIEHNYLYFKGVVMMKKIVVIGVATLLSACSMTTQNIAGTYKGTLPCGDCDKIEATLVLNADSSYHYSPIYFKNNIPNDYDEDGKFSWDKNKENVIVLDENSGNIKFKVGDNYVEMCDPDGNVVVSSFNYKLRKVKKSQVNK